ncbi:sugar phosphate nucleotidyltransferase [Desulfopila sp. IMCC35008]|uniref:nucleotidyltransferase family protein n=1 Tax=Desulfopila sp. IMCC35008 TaxID=2653858 RepID=UPI0013D65BDA|nr:sugar phosphate nucleotidyltransferase [Desulfopila sp. IMCC35008]
MQAMILAAGFGTRLLPHTLIRPKPLFPILNIPLLLLTVQRLQHSGFDHIIVNCHHLREQISKAMAGCEGVTVIEEELILGTGGGLRNAFPLMRDEPLFITNGDIYHTIDCKELYHFHTQSRVNVTLAMHDYARFNTVCVAGDHVADFSHDEAGQMLAFTGLHVINPDILQTLEKGREYCIIDLYRSLLKSGERLQIMRVDNSYWTDMGTTEDYLSLHEGLLTGKVPVWREIQHKMHKPFLVDEDALLTGMSSTHEWGSVGRVTGKNVSLARVVIWDGVQLPENCEFQDQLISSTPDRRK